MLPNELLNLDGDAEWCRVPVSRTVIGRRTWRRYYMENRGLGSLKSPDCSPKNSPILASKALPHPPPPPRIWLTRNYKIPVNPRRPKARPPKTSRQQGSTLLIHCSILQVLLILLHLQDTSVYLIPSNRFGTSTQPFTSLGINVTVFFRTETQSIFSFKIMHFTWKLEFHDHSTYIASVKEFVFPFPSLSRLNANII